MYIKYFKLKEAPYKNAEYLMVNSRYCKGVGYELAITPVGVENRGNLHLISTMFGSEYFNYYRVSAYLIKEAKRRSAKAEATADELIKNSVQSFLNNYMSIVADRGGMKLELSGEVI